MRRAFLLVLLTACGGTEPPAQQQTLEHAGRIITITAPESSEAARASGCASYGANVGSGVGNLVILSGGLQQHLEPDDFSGRINLVLIANAKRWSDADFDLEFLDGEASPNGFLVSSDSLVGNFPKIKLSPDNWFETAAAPFEMPVPIFSDFIGQLELTSAKISGQISVDTNGTTITHGVLTGYATEPAIRGVLAEVNTACASPAPPEVCPFAKEVLAMNGEEDVYPELLSFLGGADARVENGYPYPCDQAIAGSCNAVSACLLFEIAPALVERSVEH